jgi:hypothetical protein
MILKNIKVKKILVFIDKKPWIIFVSFLLLIFFLFKGLFGYYFEADEWVHFTYYFPLTRDPNGLWMSIISTFINTGPLSGGQHVVPVASVIYFLNTKFFGLTYEPYAFMSLFLHALNSFLVFFLIKILSYRLKPFKQNIFAILGSFFFAVNPASIHTITGAAPFYGQNILSVTFFLLSIIFLKKAFIKKEKKIIYWSVVFLFMSLLTKETAAFLFVLLPFMALIEKKIFSFKFLLKIYSVSLIIYLILRFLAPNITTFSEKITNFVANEAIPASYSAEKEVDTGTIVSKDISIHKNLAGEIAFRTLTFPIKMVGTSFMPRDTVFSIVGFVTPIVQPMPPGGDTAELSQRRLNFLYGPGNGFIIFLVGLGIIMYCVKKSLMYFLKKEVHEGLIIATGFSIIVLSALPLVAIIFSFPRWGYDFYFDSRFYYNPSVGAAILFPFLLVAIARFVSKSFGIKSLSLIAIVIFLIWLVNNMYAFDKVNKQFTNKFGSDRRNILNQLKDHVPFLSKKTVFYFETDGLSAFGPALPFYTSVPQALILAYYKEDPLPNVFLSEPLFDENPQGYSYLENRGIGYYTSKKDLSKDLALGDFEINEIFAFYFQSSESDLIDITSKVRKEMEEYIVASDTHSWTVYDDDSLGVQFLYPDLSQVEKLKIDHPGVADALELKNSDFEIEMIFLNVDPSFSIISQIQFLDQGNKYISGFEDADEQELFFDKYQSNKAIVANRSERYFVKKNDTLAYVKIKRINQKGLETLERIIGSIEDK